MSAAKLGLDDLHVGQRFASRTLTITAEAIKRFASEFDPQPFHTDEAAAVDSFFGGLAASGWHTAALSMRLLVESMPIAGGVIGGGGEIRWTRPVRPGDTLRTEVEILEITPSRSKPGRAAVKVLVTTLDQHDQTVQTFAPTMVVTRADG